MYCYLIWNVISSNAGYQRLASRDSVSHVCKLGISKSQCYLKNLEKLGPSIEKGNNLCYRFILWIVWYHCNIDTNASRPLLVLLHCCYYWWEGSYFGGQLDKPGNVHCQWCWQKALLTVVSVIYKASRPLWAPLWFAIGLLATDTRGKIITLLVGAEEDRALCTAHLFGGVRELMSNWGWPSPAVAWS